MICSVLFGLTFFLFVYFTKELQAHPMKLIMLMALSESAFEFMIIAQLYICKTGANHLFSYSVYFETDEYHLARSTRILIFSGLYSMFFFMLFSLALNTMLCLDLILMVRYPFYNKESRLKMYLLAALCLAMPPASLLAFKPLKIFWLRVGAAFTTAYVFIYFLIFLTSVIYTWSKLRGPSFSKEVRYLVMKRHIITSCVYLFSNTYIFLTFFYILFIDLDTLYSINTYNSWWTRGWKIIFAL